MTNMHTSILLFIRQARSKGIFHSVYSGNGYFSLCGMDLSLFMEFKLYLFNFCTIIFCSHWKVAEEYQEEQLISGCIQLLLLLLLFMSLSTNYSSRLYSGILYPSLLASVAFYCTTSS